MILFPRIRTAAAVVALAACGGAAERQAAADWPDIQQRDTLVVLTAFNSTSYFSYRGEPMGFEYELVRDFAHANGLALRTEVLDGEATLLEALDAGRGDLVAARLVADDERRKEHAFTRPLYTTRPVVVQRAGPPAEAGLPARADSLLRWSDRPVGAPAQVRVRPITTPEELAGDSVHVPARSPYQRILAELSDTITGDITIVEVEADSAAEALVREVARGAIDLTVSTEDVAALRRSYFQNLEVQPAVGPMLPVAWAVRRNSPQLKAALDRWIAEKSSDGTIDRLYRKYFIDRRGYQERVESEYLTSETGRLSPYDSLFKHYAPQLGWDWRLLAAQAYQESRFEPSARSWAGAQGLLQLMPGTAREVGVRDINDPAQNVQGAVRFTQDLMKRWAREIPDSTERLKFVLASYNTGPGHVQDAQRLAQKHGRNPRVWNDVAFWLLQKSKRAVYTDPVVRHGFSRGLEPVTYVQKILERFENYRQFVPVEGRMAAAGPLGVRPG